MIQQMDAEFMEAAISPCCGAGFSQVKDVLQEAFIVILILVYFCIGALWRSCSFSGL